MKLRLRKAWTAAPVFLLGLLVWALVVGPAASPSPAAPSPVSNDGRRSASEFSGVDRTSARRGFRPAFRGTSQVLDRRLRRRMTGNSWRRGCPVPLSQLRSLKVRHWGFDGRVHQGYLVVHADSARDMLTVTRQLFRIHYAIRRMRLVDRYGSNDRRSMRHDNTSAFNCREVSGRPGVWSQHAYGRAIDVNPVENPYVSGSYVSPPKGAPFADRRPRRTGMIAPRGAVVRIFSRAGWEWGGAWSGAQDYQHFSATGS